MDSVETVDIGCRQIGGLVLEVPGLHWNDAIACYELSVIDVIDLAGPSSDAPGAVAYTTVDAGGFDTWYAANRHDGLVQDGLVFRRGEVLGPPAPPPAPVPDKVSNFQARFIMRQTPMPDGRSLFTTVDKTLRDAVEATRLLPEFDPARLDADVAWQAWEQANDYLRDGQMVNLLATRFNFDEARTDALFRAAEKVRI